MRLGDCRNFSDVLRLQGRKNPDRTFLFDIKSERSYTFGEFDGLVDRAAFYLRSKQIEPGEIVTAVISNSPEYCLLYFAVLRAGAVFNPMPYSSHKEEVLKNIGLVDPKLILVDRQKAGLFEGEASKIQYVPVGKDNLFEQEIAAFAGEGPFEWSVDENAPACLYHSSGTTSEPKGVPFTHRNMIANIASICRGFRFKAEHEIHLSFLPLGHTASINYSLLPCVYTGGRFVLAEDFWPIRFKIWDLVEAHGITYMETVPTVLYSLLNIYREGTDRDLSSLRWVGCGSAPLQTAIQENFEACFGRRVGNLYGLSETGPTHVDYPLSPGWRAGSIGVPLDVNEVRILDEDGRECAEGKVGEIAIKGENVFPGYFKNPRLTREVFRGEYFLTGDLGYEKAGRHFFVDRKKDLIIKGGINIVPAEIDEVLMKHPSVKEGVTVGVPDDIFGEEIRSYVVLKDGKTATGEDIVAHCREHLSAVKIPLVVEIVMDIPKTASGKLMRRKLRSP